MEAKKNPAKDVHRMSGMFFQIGLGISIAIVIVVFEWTTASEKPRLRIVEEPPMDLLYIPATNPVEPPPPSLVKNEILSKPTMIQNLVVKLSSSSEESDDIPNINIDQQHDVPTFTIEEEPAEDPNKVFTAPQKAAEPVGGYAAFYELLRKNMKYPNKARRYNVSGKVYIEFIINKDGTPVDFKTFKGLGYGCDEEAIRVISLSKWNPGQQRGNPVRAKMIMPIIFQLN